MENTNWIQDVDGGIMVLCFDSIAYDSTPESWDIDEAWTVFVPAEDLTYIFDEIRSGYRPMGQAGVTQDLLADYDSEHFDKGTAGFNMYLGEVSRGEWIPEVEWLEANFV